MQQELLKIIDWIARQEQALAVFVFVYVAVTVLGLPGSPFTLAAAILFGFWKGLATVLVGANVGAALAFLCARYLARDWIEKRLRRWAPLFTLDASIKQCGWRFVLLLRLTPIFPFNALNYALGLSGIPFREYLGATVLGIIPGTVAYIYVGMLIGDLTRIGMERERTAVEWLLSLVGLVATVVCVIYLVRLAQSHLQNTHRGSADDKPG